MRLIAAVSVLDERTLLPGCIDMLDAADRIVVVDGAFADYPHDAPTSTDGTIEWLLERAAADPRIELVRKDDVWPDEVTKRNAYLLGQRGDFYVVVDADERLYGGDELKTVLARASEDSFVLPFFDTPSDAAPIPVGRIFRHLQGIRYEGGDGRVVAGGKTLVTADTAEGTLRWREEVPGPRLIHLQHRRTPERKARREAYLAQVIERDAALSDEVRRSGVDVVARWRDRQRG